jgi:protoheme IX farnesyltransferase
MKNKEGNILKDYLELSKLRIMIPVSLTGFTGYFIFDPHFSAKILLISAAILMLSIAASVLNQIQEVEIDSKMNRTKNRPLPSGKTKMGSAIIFFLINLISGTVILYFAGNILAAIIGLITIFWYNIIYTYLKRITAFAVVPGSITGALPPLIGWVAAGGGPWDRSIIFLEFLFFTGQIPHFWLMILKYGEEYKTAGLPSMTEIFNSKQINRLTFTWAVSTFIAAMFLCSFGIIHSLWIIGVLLAGSIYSVWKFSDLLRLQVDRSNYIKYSLILYSYFLAVMILLVTDRIIL